MADTALIRILEDCCLRVVGMSGGSGFFVTPGLLLTCSHVVGGMTTDIQVTWNDRNETASVVENASDPDDDIALLALNVIDHQCVRLGTNFDSDDELFGCGYPASRATPQMDGFKAQYESSTRLDKPGRYLIKFRNGQVLPGYSGGPLLDERTGDVIGVITETRDQRLNLGGWAVPIEFIFNRWPWIGEKNKDYHLHDATWQNAMLQDAQPHEPARRNIPIKEHALSRAVLRELLDTAFAEDDLRNFCFDYFPEVESEFTSGQTKAQRVRALILYAETRSQLSKLVGSVRAARLATYAQFERRLFT
jgi:Effector-associated domain 7/Trypsin-like peptidase domain